MGSSPSKTQTKVTAVSRIQVTPVQGGQNSTSGNTFNAVNKEKITSTNTSSVNVPNTNSNTPPVTSPLPPPPPPPPAPPSTKNNTPSVHTNSILIKKTDNQQQKEDAEVFHKRVLDIYKGKITKSMKAWHEDKDDTEVQCDVINSTNTIFFEMREYPEWVDKHRTVVCNYIHQEGHIIEAVCKSILSEKAIISRSSIAGGALLVIVNLSDHSTELSKAICAVPGYIQCIYDTCDEHKDCCTTAQNIDPYKKQLLIRLLMIMHNVAMTEDNIPLLQEMEFVPVLQKYLSFPNDTIKMTAILAMADIMTEEESSSLNANFSIIKFLIKTFERSVNDKGHHASDGSGMIWSSLELVKGVGRLARNDGNKRLLVDQGCLPSLLKLANSEDIVEQKESLKSLWALAFNEHNQESMMKEPGLIKFIDEKNRTGASDIRSTCYGILWTMRVKLLESAEFKTIGQRLSVKRATTAKKRTITNGVTEKADIEMSEKEEEAEKGHVMISYQWANQKILKQVRDRIRDKNHKVWMDIDDMEGSTLQAMAQAIENAEIVVICMSRKYKDSPNCRAEAEYAHQLRKKVVPLIMERGYRPDGWLGMILGAKLFYDFSGKYPFESKIDGLLKELTLKLKGEKEGPAMHDEIDGPEETIVPVRQQLMYAPSRPPQQKMGSIKSWSKNQIKDWLTKHQLIGSAVQKLTGKEVAFLRKIQVLAPDFYYQTLKNDLILKGLTDMANFEAAMDDLP